MSVDYVYGLFAYLRIVQSMDWVSSVIVCESWVEWFQSHYCLPARPFSQTTHKKATLSESIRPVSPRRSTIDQYFDPFHPKTLDHFKKESRPFISKGKRTNRQYADCVESCFRDTYKRAGKRIEGKEVRDEYRKGSKETLSVDDIDNHLLVESYEHCLDPDRMTRIARSYINGIMRAA